MRKFTSTKWGLFLLGFILSFNLTAQDTIRISQTSSPNSCDGWAVIDRTIVTTQWTWYNGFGDSIIQNGGDTLKHLCPGEYSMKFFSVQANDSKTVHFHIGNMNGGNNGGPMPNNKPCQAYFKANPLDTNGFEFMFKDASRVDSGTVVSHIWKLDGQAVSTSASFEHLFTLGMHQVSLTITTSKGCEDTYADSTRFPNFGNNNNGGNNNGGNNGGPMPNDKPCQAYFKANPLDSTGFKFVFNDASRVDSGKVVSYIWKLDGQPISTSASFDHVFLQGMHHVSLTIATTKGCEDTYTDSTSFPNFGNNNGGGSNNGGNNGGPMPNDKPCQAYFKANPLDSTGFKFVFNDASRVDSGKVVSYIWKLDDQPISTNPSFDHVFIQGMHHVSLTIVTTKGCEDTYTDSISFPNFGNNNGGGNNGGNNGGPIPNGKPCQADFKANPLDSSGFKFMFKDASRVDSGTVISRIWKLDGEQVSTSSSFDHVFTQGMHHVSLTITTSKGCEDTYIDSASFPNFDNGGNNEGGENPNPCNGTNLNGYISSMIPSLGNECTGKFFVNVNGGVAPYEFHLKKIADSSFHRMNENPLFNELCADEYLVIIKDKKGCEKRIPAKVHNDTSNVNNPCHGSPLTITFSSTNSTKLGRNECNGSLVATISGAANYTYQWSDGLGSSSLEQSNLCPGEYRLTVTSNGCVRSEKGIVKFGDMTNPCTGSTLEGLITYSVPSKPNECTGKLGLRVSGGAIPYTFEVKNYNSNSSVTFENPHFENLCPGTYSVIVKDSLGCSKNFIGHIGKDSINNQPHPCANSELAVSIVPTNVSSQGQCDGSLETTVMGAVNYTYEWSNNLGSDNLSPSGLCPGLYKLRVSSNGCSIEVVAKVGINLPTNPCVNSTLFAALTTTNETGVNACDGSAAVTVSGGISPYNYHWNIEDTNSFVTSLCPDTYRVKVKDAQGCVVIATGIVGRFIPNDAPRPRLRGHVIPTGETETGACDGSASAIVHGGTEPYTYEFSNNSTESSTAYLCAGLNYVKVTDAKGDTLRLEFVITSPANTIENHPHPDSTIIDSIYNNVLENCVINFAAITSTRIRGHHFVGSDSIAVDWEVISAGDTIKIVNVYAFSSTAGTYRFVIQLYCPTKSIDDKFLTATDELYLEEGNAAGINELIYGNVGIYPNPFTDHIIVSLDNDQTSDIIIRDISGREVFNKKFNNKLINIDMNAFSSGQYLITVRNNSAVVTRKMIK